MTAAASFILFSFLAAPLPQDPIPPQLRAPAAPVFDPFQRGTKDPTVTVSGTANSAVEVWLTTPLEPKIVVPVVAQKFTVDVTLKPNAVNLFTAVSINADGVPSAPGTTSIIQDQTPPELFIDFPVDGSVIETLDASPTTDVAGRVGDALSGFMNLTVRVNNITAEVNPGIGTNGTFFLAGLPLNSNGDTTIEVLAADRLANVVVKSIVVTHEQIVDDPAITMLTGNGQSGEVLSELPLPVRVHVQKADGSDFPGKVVTFKASQSDGRVSATQGVPGELMAQVLTDANGDAEVWWTLGSDAGEGNNRLRATSTGAKGTVEFCATAVGKAAQQIAVGMGDDQWGETGSPSIHPLSVFVHDGQNGVEGESVVFSVVSGGGLVDGKSIAIKETDLTGHTEVPFVFGPDAGPNVVEATFSGNPSFPARFVLDGIARNPEKPTRFRGVVVDNALQPLQNAGVTLELLGESFTTTTDLEGVFKLTDITVSGNGHLKIDGSTVDYRGGESDSGEPVDPGTYPFLEYEAVVVQGGANELPTPVMLPELKTENQQLYDGNELALEINTTDPDTGQPVPMIEGLEFKVLPGTVVTWQGQTWGAGNPIPLSVNLVHIDKIPMPLPDGAGPPFAWTLQPGGAKFDPPIQVTIPNSAGLGAGAVAYILSFDHDLGAFLIVSNAKVTEDGASIVSDAGDGIDKAGWGGFCPPYPPPGRVRRLPTEDPCDFSDYERPTRHSPLAAPTPEVRSDDFVEMAKSMARQEVKQEVYGFNGEYYNEAIDMRIRGVGFDFIWGRKYRTQLGPAGYDSIDNPGGTRQGNKWDNSYNVRLVSDIDGIKLYDGSSREDVYIPISDDGPWCKRGFLRELQKNQDGTYSLFFADKSQWVFHNLAANPDGGLLWKSIDRNGNEMVFDYDFEGKLVRVTDTTGRDIVITYRTSSPNYGYLESVTDYDGRTVTYEYYASADPDGEPGDLKSVTTPATADYPMGKTTVYKYRKDHPFESFLVSITDPKGQDYLELEYKEGFLPDDFEYRRVDRMRVGGPGDWIDYEYEDLHPEDTLEPILDMPTKKATVTDRNGNVVDYFYDDCNREHRKVVHASPSNYVWKYEWNDDYLLTKTIEPDGTRTETIYEGDVRPGCPVRNRANVVMRLDKTGPDPTWNNNTGQKVRKWTYEYDTTATTPGDPSDGYNFVTREIDPRGLSTEHDYDANGNRIETRHPEPGVVENWTYRPADGQVLTHTLPSNGSVRRTDRYEYDANGYLSAEIVDDNGLALRTDFGRNAVGILTSLTDPNGSTTTFDVNARDQLMQVTEDAGGFNFVTSFTYDANDNITSITRANVDHLGNGIGGSSTLTTTFTYEVMNNPLTELREVGIGGDILTTYEYDGNRNRTKVWVHDPNNYTAYEYDERDLVTREDRSGVLVTEYELDRKGNPVKITKGGTQVTDNVYDAYDRLVATTDPIGNTTTHTLDPNGNILKTVVKGPGGDPSGRLSEITYTYDGMNRRRTENVAYFSYDSGAGLDGGSSLTTTVYSPNSQVLSVTNPRGHTTSTSYDSANRVSEVVDAAGNRTQYTYDDNGNVTVKTEIEVSDGGSGETFVTSYTYDALDRMTSETNAVGQTIDYGYDSRDNRTFVRDANNYETVSVFDGENRLVSTTREKDGSSNIVTEQEWDENSRLLSQTDGNGNETTYTYDDLDRLLTTTMADGTSKSVLQYDVHGNELKIVDANGTVIDAIYDDGNRVTSRTITPGPGVSGDTTTESYTYDGFSNVLTASDDDSSLTRSYNSLGKMMDETLTIGPLDLPSGPVTYTTRTVQNSYDRAGNLVECIYPGGRTIAADYDELERKETVRDTTGGGNVVYADYDFVGPDRVERCDLLNGVSKFLTYDGVSNLPGDFGVRRVVESLHQFDPDPNTPGDEVVIDHRTYAWGRMQNKTRRTDVRAGGPELTHTYAYDRSYRLTKATVEDATMTVLRDEDYQIDRVGNREQVSGIGVLYPGTYFLDPSVPDPADYQVNQYTTTPADGQRLYDDNGNLLVSDDGTADQADMAYDYLNRMVSYADAATGQLARYFYDAAGRRIARVTDAAGTSETNLYYYTPAGRVCEERNGSEVVQATYVYGQYIDEVLSMARGGQDFFYHGDDLHNVMALTDAAGAVLERYEYGDYGQVLDSGTLQPLGIPLASGNSFYFTGARYDSECGLYYLRTRYLDPVAGRFRTRDPLGVWADKRSTGNAYSYAGNNPWRLRDPSGMQSQDVEQLEIPIEEEEIPRRVEEESAGRANAAASLSVAGYSRYPVPGAGLTVGLDPLDGFENSTRSIHIQDKTGRKHLSLDKHVIERTNKPLSKAAGTRVPFSELHFDANGRVVPDPVHWNQKGVQQSLANANHPYFRSLSNTTNHTPLLNSAAERVHSFAKGARGARGALGLAGAGLDVAHVATAENKARAATGVAGGWAGAWAGTQGGFVAGAYGGPWGAAAGALGGSIIGYWGGSSAAEGAYDYVIGD